MAELAAADTAGIVKNHPFVDGNKRTGFMLGVGFLERNGHEFHALCPEPFSPGHKRHTSCSSAPEDRERLASGEMSAASVNHRTPEYQRSTFTASWKDARGLRESCATAMAQPFPSRALPWRSLIR
jgi:hypothetical protein